MKSMLSLRSLSRCSAALMLLAACGGGETADSPRKVSANVPGNGSPAATSAQSGTMVQQAPSRGPEHPVYSLHDNRLSAHLVRSGGLLVHGGSPGFAKYMRYRFKGPNWKVAETVDGARASIIEGSTGRIDVPLTAAQAKGPVKIKMHVHNEGDRRVGFRVNGNKDKEVTVEVTAGWSTAEVEIPDGAFHAGDNEILMFTSKGSPMAVGWMQIGGDTSAEPTTDFAAANSLVLPKAGGLAYHVVVPDKGLVAGDLSDPKCKVEVSAEPDDGEAVTGTLTGKGSAVDLSKLAGNVVRLELIAAGCDRAELANAALVVPGEAPTFARKPAKPKYVILWVMDSLRADRIRVFNPDAPAEVPTFEKLVDSSTVFTHNYVQGNESKASHASIWSSLYPVNHRYYQKKNKFVVDAQKIDAAMKKAGFYTSGVSGNGYIIPRRGFGDSWDAFRNHIHDPGGLKGQEILDPALESVEGKTEPWFLYIGTIDTHVSWRAKEPWMSKLDPEPYSGRFKTTASGPDVGKIVGGGIKVDDRDIKRIRALYNSNVSYQDDLVRQLFEKLEEWGIADETMVIFTADHGDEQFEVSKRRVGHGTSLRETLVWVPLIIHYPPLFPAGKVNTGTEVIDILPTIADVLGIPMNDHWQGQSLLPLANGVGQDYPRMSFASQYEEAHTARVGKWKYEYGRSGAELFDLKAEPLEKTNLADKKPYAYQMMSDAFWLLRMWNRDWKKSEWGNALNVTPEFAAAVSK